MTETEALTLEPRELDALVAEVVMGISLKPQREKAMCQVAFRHLSATGQPFILDDGSEIFTKAGDLLSDPYPGAHWNDRYAYEIAKQKQTEWAEEIEAVREKPEDYSTTWSGLGLVVERMREKGWMFTLDDLGFDGDKWRAGFHENHQPDGRWGTSEDDKAPKAVCLAALKALGAIK